MCDDEIIENGGSTAPVGDLLFTTLPTPAPISKEQTALFGENARLKGQVDPSDLKLGRR